MRTEVRRRGRAATANPPREDPAISAPAETRARKERRVRVLREVIACSVRSGTARIAHAGVEDE
jgi:hypothetical protein